jgi:hypothetical protein
MFIVSIGVLLTLSKVISQTTMIGAAKTNCSRTTSQPFVFFLTLLVFEGKRWDNDDSPRHFLGNSPSFSDASQVIESCDWVQQKGT